MKRTIGLIGAWVWIGIFLVLALGHAHGDELAGALAHLAAALHPPPPARAAPGLAQSGSGASDTPGALFLVLAGLLLGGGALCVWLGDRARARLTTEDPD